MHKITVATAQAIMRADVPVATTVIMSINVTEIPR